MSPYNYVRVQRENKINNGLVVCIPSVGFDELFFGPIRETVSTTHNSGKTSHCVTCVTKFSVLPASARNSTFYLRWKWLTQVSVDLNKMWNRLNHDHLRHEYLLEKTKSVYAWSFTNAMHSSYHDVFTNKYVFTLPHSLSLFT